MNLKGANEFAKEQGYDGADFLKKWHGYNCYEPYMRKNENEYACIGFPPLVLEKDGNFRMSTIDEAIDITDSPMWRKK